MKKRSLRLNLGIFLIKVILARNLGKTTLQFGLGRPRTLKEDGLSSLRPSASLMRILGTIV